MAIELSPELERIVNQKVADGTYASEEQVVRAALMLLVDDDVAAAEYERLRAWAAEGFADLDSGRLSSASVEDIKRTARQRFLG